jgi:hypothetical protein
MTSSHANKEKEIKEISSHIDYKKKKKESIGRKGPTRKVLK